MKLAIVIDRFEAWRGGAETSTTELSRHLTALGHDVHVITTTNTPAPPDMTIHPIPVRAALRPLRMAAFVRKAAAFLRRHTFDIVHAISPLACADVYQPRGGLVEETLRQNVATRSTATRRAMKRALVAMSFKQRKLLELERDIFREDGPLILAVSKYVARQCEAFYGASAPRVRVVFNGVGDGNTSADARSKGRAAVRGQYHVGDDTLLLLFIAHNLRLKGMTPLIRIVSRLAASGFDDFRLLVVGRDNPVRYQRRLQALGLDRYVTFTGPTRRVASFFHAADVCVHPTYYDPCSRVVLEALSRGVPCITTALNGACEVIHDGLDGFVIESPDDDALWARRIEALRSDDLRRRISSNALLLRDRISMSRHAAELDVIYGELVERKRGRCRSA